MPLPMVVEYSLPNSSTSIYDSAAEFPTDPEETPEKFPSILYASDLADDQSARWSNAHRSSMQVESVPHKQLEEAVILLRRSSLAIASSVAKYAGADLTHLPGHALFEKAKMIAPAQDETLQESLLGNGKRRESNASKAQSGVLKINRVSAAKEANVATSTSSLSSIEDIDKRVNQFLTRDIARLTELENRQFNKLLPRLFFSSTDDRQTNSRNAHDSTNAHAQFMRNLIAAEKQLDRLKRRTYLTEPNQKQELLVNGLNLVSAGSYLQSPPPSHVNAAISITVDSPAASLEKSQQQQQFQHRQSAFDGTSPLIFQSAQQQLPIIVNNGLSNSAMVTKGRKPIRLILEALNQKIAFLRESSSEMKAFRRRVAMHKAENQQHVHSNLVKSNINTTFLQLPKNKQLQLDAKMTQRREHFAQVLTIKSELEEARQLKLRALLKNQLNPLKPAAISTKTKCGSQDRNNLLKKRWLCLIMMGSRVQLMKEALQKAQADKFHWLHINRSASSIQRIWRRFSRRRHSRQQMQSMIVLNRFFHRVSPICRLRIQHRSANVIRGFLQDAFTLGRLMNVIKRYRYQVVVCQRAAKRFLETRNCRVQVLVKQWEKTESIWWHTRTSADSAKKLLNYSLAEDSAKQPIAAKPKSKKSKKKDDATFKIPEAIKLQLLREDVIQRHKKHVESYWKSREAIVKWVQKVKQTIGMLQFLKTSSPDISPQTANNFTTINPPPAALASPPDSSISKKVNDDRPHLSVFKVVLLEVDLIRLIERGFMMATDAKSPTSS